MIENDITMIGGLQKHQSPRSDGICPCVNSAARMGGGQTPIAIRPGFRVRKLTQRECWRLMGFTDEDFAKAQTAMNQNLYSGNDRSGSQLYKQAGNSIVVDVLCAIMGELCEAMPYLFEDMVVGSFSLVLALLKRRLPVLINRLIATNKIGLSKVTISTSLDISTTTTEMLTAFTMEVPWPVP